MLIVKRENMTTLSLKSTLIKQSLLAPIMVRFAVSILQIFYPSYILLCLRIFISNKIGMTFPDPFKNKEMQKVVISDCHFNEM